MLQQRTLKSLTHAVGLGVHSGQKVELTLKPAPPDSGIVFRRVDLPVPVEIPVSVTAVSDTRMATTISPGGHRASPRCRPSSTCCRPAPGWGWTTWSSTSAARRCRCSTARRPASSTCCKARASSLQDAPKRFLRVKKAVEIREGEGATLKWARLEPYHGYKLSFEIEFNHPAVDETGQQVVFDFSEASTSATSRARAPSASPRTWR